MSVAEYPLPSVSGSNPSPLLWLPVAPQQFQVDFTAFDDGGRDFKKQAGGTGILRWSLEYDGLTVALAAILDAHALSASLDQNGLSASGFNYRDRDGTLYSNVHYEKYEKPPWKKIWCQARKIQLVRFPS